MEYEFTVPAIHLRYLVYLFITLVGAGDGISQSTSMGSQHSAFQPALSQLLHNQVL